MAVFSNVSVTRPCFGRVFLLVSATSWHQGAKGDGFAGTGPSIGQRPRFGCIARHPHTTQGGGSNENSFSTRFWEMIEFDELKAPTSFSLLGSELEIPVSHSNWSQVTNTKNHHVGRFL